MKSGAFSMVGHHVRSWLPTRGNVLFTLVLVAGLLWAQNAGAFPDGSPRAPSSSTGTIPFQGRLSNSSENPLTGTFPMAFRLYSLAQGSSPLWEETWSDANSVPVTNGHFNVMLGSLTSIPPSVFTGQSSLWLGISVGADSEMTPRLQLGSVPYAVQALTVPDGSITTAKIADENITSDKVADGAVFSSKLHLTQASYFNLQEGTKGVTVDYGDLSDAVDQVGIDLPTAQWIYVYYSAIARNTLAGANAFMRLSYDGTPTYESRIQTAGNVEMTMTGVDRKFLSAGTHTIAAQYFAGSGTINVHTRKILVVAVGP